jgi:glutamyl-tRNA synthetase
MTHVVRGDDHISNTPKQILLYEAIGAAVPKFAHVPLILGPDKKRLSKRHGATSVTEYRTRGYLPEAMMNFLALLGWSPGAGDKELFARDELVGVFALEGISGGNAVFNPEKLDWFNQQYIVRLAPGDLARRLKPFFEAAGVWDEAYLGSRREWFFAVLEQLKPRAKTLTEFSDLGRFLFVDRLDYDEAAVARHVRAEGMRGHLEAVESAFAALPAFDAASAEAALRSVAETRSVKAAVLIHAVRVALTGRTVSPGLFEVAALLGRERTRARLVDAIRMSV